jgi:DNA polymerase-1
VTDERQRLFLIDGHALVYRAFFAMARRPLTTSRGENTSAAWGIANFLIRLFREHQPHRIAWIFDKGDSFRHEMFPAYKATREKLDAAQQEDFDRSMARTAELLRAWRVPVVTVEGYEADDVIGTLASQATRAGVETVVVSGDKDFYQLINEDVTLLNPGRRGPAAVDEEWVDESNASERLGVPPNRVVDFLALVGDSSDNVPGVPGVGAKTARQLLTQFGDLDAVLGQASDVPSRKVREALLGHADTARLSRELVTIRRDVPVSLDLDALTVQPPDQDALLRLLAELEFHTLIPQVASGGAPAESPPVTVVQDVAELERAVAAARSSGRVTLAVEGTQSDPISADLVGIAMAVSPEQVWYFPLGHEREPELLMAEVPWCNLPPLGDTSVGPLVELLEDARVSKLGYDLKHAWLILRGAGAELGGATYDVLLASFVLDPGRRSHALGALALERLGQPAPADGANRGRARNTTPPAQRTPADAGARLGEECRLAFQLADGFESELVTYGLRGLLDDLEVPLIEVLVDMEWRGIAINPEWFARLARELAAELRDLEGRIHEAAGVEFNVNSTAQLRHVLFEKLMLPVVKRTKTGPSTDADVLDQLATQGHEVPQLILQYRELAKLKSTYVDVLPARVNKRTGRIHTRFNQAGAATGRVSSSDPNLQNIPIRTARGEEIRRGFVAAPGCSFIVADYSQIELRLLAHLSGDPGFVDAFSRGGDIHRQTASVVFGVESENVTAEMRARAKTINFATIYGQGPYALARQLGIAQDEARQFIREYFERFAGVRAWLDRTVADARANGYVETILGRRRYIPELRDQSHSVRSFGERTATNSPLQGSAADIIKLAMIRIHRTLKERQLAAWLLLQVHDELVLEAEQSAVDMTRSVVQNQMESVTQLRVPLVVNVGVATSWLEAKA